MRIADCMSRSVLSVQAQASVREALDEMAAHDVCHLLVIAEDGLRGVVCRHDLEAVSGEQPITGWTASPVLVVLPSATLEQAAVLMREAHVGFLPVVEGHQVVGVVARSDLYRARAGGSVSARCRCCGTTRHLRSHDGMIRCLDCLLESEGTWDPHAQDDLGVGD